jgi:hypothetical protein
MHTHTHTHVGSPNHWRRVASARYGALPHIWRYNKVQYSICHWKYSTVQYSTPAVIVNTLKDIGSTPNDFGRTANIIGSTTMVRDLYSTIQSLSIDLQTDLVQTAQDIGSTPLYSTVLPTTSQRYLLNHSTIIIVLYNIV